MHYFNLRLNLIFYFHGYTKLVSAHLIPVRVSGIKTNKPSATLSGFVLCSSPFVCALHLTSVVKTRNYILSINIYQLQTLLTKWIFLLIPLLWWYKVDLYKLSCGLENLTDLLLLMPTPRHNLGTVADLKFPPSSSSYFFASWSESLGSGFGLLCKCICIFALL